MMRDNIEMILSCLGAFPLSRFVACLILSILLYWQGRKTIDHMIDISMLTFFLCLIVSITNIVHAFQNIDKMDNCIYRCAQSLFIMLPATVLTAAAYIHKRFRNSKDRAQQMNA